MEVVLYNSESEMPCYLRKEKNPAWNTLDKQEWDEWNFVPKRVSQPSKFHNHVTWKSHRHDYLNRAQVMRETQAAAAKREKYENRRVLSAVSNYEKEMKEAQEEEAKWEAEEKAEEEARKVKEAEEAVRKAEWKAMKQLQETITYTNTVIPEPQEYIPFKKMTPAQKAQKKAIANKKYYAANKDKNKAKNKKKDDEVYDFCSVCGGEHKMTTTGRSNHNVSYQHTAKLMCLHAAEAIMNNKSHINTIEQGEAYIANLIKNSEDKLCRKLTRAEVKNKYKRLAAQYAS